MAALRVKMTGAYLPQIGLHQISYKWKHLPRIECNLQHQTQKCLDLPRHTNHCCVLCWECVRIVAFSGAMEWNWFSLDETQNSQHRFGRSFGWLVSCCEYVMRMASLQPIEENIHAKRYACIGHIIRDIQHKTIDRNPIELLADANGHILHGMTHKTQDDNDDDDDSRSFSLSLFLFLFLSHQKAKERKMD